MGSRRLRLDGWICRARRYCEIERAAGSGNGEKDGWIHVI